VEPVSRLHPIMVFGDVRTCSYGLRVAVLPEVYVMAVSERMIIEFCTVSGWVNIP